MKQLNPTELKRLHREWRRRTTGRVALVLDGLGTPANVGSILRTAAVYAVKQVWLAGATPGLDHAGVARTALGCDRYLGVARAADGAGAVEAARDAGYHVVGVELADGAVPLHELEVPDAVCLAVGHEDHGLAKGTLAACDDVAYLPQVGRVASLNVAVAAAVALYEIRRRSWTAADKPDSAGDAGADE